MKRLFCLSFLIALLVSSLVPLGYCDTATLKPSTGTHKAYYRIASNQLATTTRPTDPSWVESSATEFATADYTAVQTDDASRTSRLASATVVSRWCASSEEFTFNLSAYPSITNIEIMWDGYCKTVDVIDTEAFFKKAGASTWTNIGAVPEADGAGWEIDVNDAVCYLDSGIYKIGVLVVSTKAMVSTTANTYTDALQIIVTYTPSGGEEYERTASLTFAVSLATSRKIVITRTASQQFTFTLATNRRAEFFRATSQAITTSLATSRLAEFFRTTTQTVTFTTLSIGEIVGNYIRTAILNVALTIVNAVSVTGDSRTFIAVVVVVGIVLFLGGAIFFMTRRKS